MAYYDSSTSDDDIDAAVQDNLAFEVINSDGSVSIDYVKAQKYIEAATLYLWRRRGLVEARHGDASVRYREKSEIEANVEKAKSVLRNRANRVVYGDVRGYRT